jgi:hypothetical protein
LLHFEIIQLHRRARLATLLPCYLGYLLFRALGCRRVTPERIELASPIIALRLARPIL